MIVQSQSAAARLSLVLLLALFQSAVAQEPPRRVTSSKPQAARPAQKETPVEPADKQELLQGHEDEMRQTLDHLAAEIKLLGAELQRLRKVTDRNAQTMELLLTEERLSKVEDKIQDAIERRSQLDAREQDLQRRMRNIPNELLTRGGLRREEAEAAIKGEIQRALDEVHNQQSSYQQRLVELNAQAERLRARVETLRKKVDQVEPKTEKQDQ
jgi:ATP-dependent Lon protease